LRACERVSSHLGRGRYSPHLGLKGSGGPDYALSALFGPVEMEPIRRTDVAPALERARVPSRHGEQP